MQHSNHRYTVNVLLFCQPDCGCFPVFAKVLTLTTLSLYVYWSYSEIAHNVNHLFRITRDASKRNSTFWQKPKRIFILEYQVSENLPSGQNSKKKNVSWLKRFDCSSYGIVSASAKNYLILQKFLVNRFLPFPFEKGLGFSSSCFCFTLCRYLYDFVSWHFIRKKNLSSFIIKYFNIYILNIYSGMQYGTQHFVWLEISWLYTYNYVLNLLPPCF